MPPAFHAGPGDRRGKVAQPARGRGRGGARGGAFFWAEAAGGVHPGWFVEITYGAATWADFLGRGVAVEPRLVKQAVDEKERGNRQVASGLEIVMTGDWAA